MAIASKTYGYVDSATVTGAIIALDSAEAGSWTEWEQESALAATYLLLDEKIRITPGPGRFIPYGLLERFYAAVGDLRTTVDPQKRARANALTQDWLKRNPKRLAEELAKLERNKADSFDPWLRGELRLFWADHARMHDGLFDRDFIPHLAAATGSAASSLKKIWQRSRDRNIVASWLRGANLPTEAKEAQRAFLFSAIARGKYHQHVGEATACHFASHPLRAGVIRTQQTRQREDISTATEIFVKILIGSARGERKIERRVDVWGDNIKQARSAMNRLVLTENLGSNAESQAAEAAQSIGLPARARNVEKWLSLAPPLALAGLAAVVKPWVGLTIGAITVVLQPSLKKSVTRLTRTKRRYKALADMIPGSIALRQYES